MSDTLEPHRPDRRDVPPAAMSNLAWAVVDAWAPVIRWLLARFAENDKGAAAD